MNILRRLPLSRLLLLCAAVVAIGISATAIASGLDAGPTPQPKALAQAIHDALQGSRGHAVQGVSAEITLTNHLLEGANLASGTEAGGELTSNPLVTGGSGRLWIGDGKLRLELQQEKGDTQLVYDGHTFSIYDAASDTVYRYTPQTGEDAGSESGSGGEQGEVPSVAKIEEALAHISEHENLSGATPTDVAGQPAYTVLVSPRETGSLLGGAELSFDADNAMPLRAAVYSSTSSTPVIELAATSISFGPVAESVFRLSPPPGAKIDEISLSHGGGSATGGRSREAKRSKPTVTTHGHGLAAVDVLEAKAHGDKSAESLEGLPKVNINGSTASELRTELGTILVFQRSGVRYLLAGFVPAGSVEALARGL